MLTNSFNTSSFIQIILEDAKILLNNKDITITNLSIYYGKLTTFLFEEYSCNITRKVSEKYLTQCAQDLVDYKQVIPLYINHNDVNDEEAIWILNPGDFKEDYV